ncbi:hypothetical protein [Limosilactobacillus pontis]|uniref:DUF4811 domain-containing protein n=1 Tax=Limosilactobacillus pontis TaxID=35787 RepID=A0ABU7STS2_9LACO
MDALLGAWALLGLIVLLIMFLFAFLKKATWKTLGKGALIYLIGLIVFICMGSLNSNSSNKKVTKQNTTSSKSKSSSKSSNNDNFDKDTNFERDLNDTVVKSKGAIVDIKYDINPATGIMNSVNFIVDDSMANAPQSDIQDVKDTASKAVKEETRTYNMPRVPSISITTKSGQSL